MTPTGHPSLQKRGLLVPTIGDLPKARRSEKTADGDKRDHINTCPMLVGWQNREVPRRMLFIRLKETQLGG